MIITFTTPKAAAATLAAKKGGEKVKPYVGTFGKGFIIVSPRWDTTQCVNISYWIETKGENND